MSATTTATHPITLTSLTSREAVADALYRAVTGLDANDLSLFESAFELQDCMFDLNGTVSTGIQEIRDNVFSAVGPLDTTHFISNVRVSLTEGEGKKEGEEEKAYMTAYALAQHYRTGEGIDLKAERGHLMSGSMYFLDLVKSEGNEGLWRIKKWGMKIVWLDGDMGVVTK